ncbi:hypothetical protein KY290_031085 [Solanum tuberosum]|uniref:Transposase-associated domain-containing protein n=1 Tax=Solanum tuberosum TaxID=4113 RepID=A0ABQ7U847_SOLTU|nr:hypothetical protein KY290_031085 [Solanum tuberosum]
MNLARYSKEYIDGVESFLDFAYSYGDPQGEEIQCPCEKCCNNRGTRRNVVYDHLICYGFVKGYTRWINHGEWDIKLNVDDDMDYSRDDIDGLLNDQFRDVAQAKGVYDGPNKYAKKFYNLVEEASQELYPGCIGFSKYEEVFVTQQLKVEYEEEFEDEFEDESENEYEDESEDGFEIESEEQFEDNAP